MGWFKRPKWVPKWVPLPGETAPRPAPIPSKNPGSGPINPNEPLPETATPIGSSINVGEDAVDAATAKIDSTVVYYVNLPKYVRQAGVAIFNFIENEVNATKFNLSATELRLREGKIVDSFWHFYIDPARSTEKNAAKAARESDLIKRAGSMAAQYSGYGAAALAAYTAWIEYRETGDFNKAIAAGIVAGVASAAISNFEGDENTLRKAIIAGAIAGSAVAATGGTADEVARGVISGSGGVIFEDSYNEQTGSTFKQDVLWLFFRFNPPQKSAPTLSNESTFELHEYRVIAHHDMNDFRKDGITISDDKWRVYWDLKYLDTGAPFVVVTRSE